MSYQPEPEEKAERPKGTIVVKAVYCGKRCRGCPHGPYAYLVTKKDGKQTWKYLGLAKDLPRVGKTVDKRLFEPFKVPCDSCVRGLVCDRTWFYAVKNDRYTCDRYVERNP